MVHRQQLSLHNKLQALCTPDTWLWTVSWALLSTMWYTIVDWEDRKIVSSQRALYLCAISRNCNISQTCHVCQCSEVCYMVLPILCCDTGLALNAGWMIMLWGTKMGFHVILYVCGSVRRQRCGVCAGIGGWSCEDNSSTLTSHPVPPASL